MKKLLISLVLLTAAYTWTQAQDAPEMKFDKSTHDYGNLVRTDKTDDPSGDCTFIVINTGKVPLIITKCTPSCGCTSPGCPQEPIMPGKSAPIKVHFNANKAGSFSKTVTIFSNASNSPLPLTIKGVVVDAAGSK